MPSTPDDGAESVLAASRGLFGLVARSLAPVLESIRLEDFRVLVLLASRGSLEVREVARLGSMSPLATDEALRRLSVQGRALVKEGIATISSSGHALVDEVTERERAEIARLLGQLADDDRRQVVDALQLITVALGEPPPEQLIVLGM